MGVLFSYAVCYAKELGILNVRLIKVDSFISGALSPAGTDKPLQMRKGTKETFAAIIQHQQKKINGIES